MRELIGDKNPFWNTLKEDRTMVNYLAALIYRFDSELPWLKTEIEELSNNIDDGPVIIITESEEHNETIVDVVEEPV